MSGSTDDVLFVCLSVLLGLAGCGGGTTVTAPEPTDAGRSDVAAADAGPADVDASEDAAPSDDCATWAAAYCARWRLCSGWGFDSRYPDVDTCTARVTIACAAWREASGVVRPALFDPECIHALVAVPCASFHIASGGLLPIEDCEPLPGQSDVGAPCFTDEQCHTLFCEHEDDGHCGTCAAPYPDGAPCDARRCGHESGCLEGNDGIRRCVTFQRLGEPCDELRPCAGGLRCAGGSCILSALEEGGAACDAEDQWSCNWYEGYFCELTQLVCHGPRPLAAAGQPCSPSPHCAGAASCIGGICVAPAEDGEQCDEIAGPRCLSAARCETGVRQPWLATDCE